MKYDLSVIVIKGYVLLPNNELKIDLRRQIEKVYTLLDNCVIFF